MLRVPRGRLPLTSADRHAALRDYFCDKDADAELDGADWKLTLSWPDGDDRHVDPRLGEGLRWWGQGVERRDMALAHRRQGRITSALYDTWTLHSWSEWLAGREMTEDVLILHVDDHRDLGSPRLFVDPTGGWRDPISNEPCVLTNPSSVRAAIESGALGMGSFLTPFLHRFPRAEVRHLCQPPKAVRTMDYEIRPTFAPDDLLELGRLRPAIDLVEAEPSPGAGRYRVTPSVEAWLADVRPGPVILHIDMDYFNNRFDGDSDWSVRPNAFDPTLPRILEKIDEMTDALARTGVGVRIEDVVIAYSPGFFPAEFWAPAEARLRPSLERLYGG
ncbi:MAG: hypothetical protein KKA16_07590 [Alphaproteobacteria bacterium]|nr:hypothetical protein [Alphaproteobacteria bacterium]MBU2380913.1 hypothetical protein [Alphaproteobacteria bacterium]